MIKICKISEETIKGLNMRMVITFLFPLIFSFLNLFAQNNRLCLECSQNFGNGYKFEKPESSKGDFQLVSSSIGLISSNVLTATDGSKLISGYMPVCVLPILGLGSKDTSFCSSKEFIISSGAYLIENIIWNVSNDLKYTINGKYNESISGINVVNEITEFDIEVFAEKGGIKSGKSTSKLILYPTLKPIFSNNFKKGENIVCNNKDIVVEIKDKYYKDDEFEVIWDDNSNLKKRIINILESEVKKSVNIKIKNKDNLCDTIVDFTFKPIKPEATIQIFPKDNKLELDPSQYEDLNNPFYLDIKLSSSNQDFDQALQVCPPTRFQAELEIPNKILLSLDKNINKISETQSYTKYMINTNIKDFTTSKELYKFFAVPIIIDEEHGTVSITSVKLLDDEGNSQIYKINSGSINIFVRNCKIDGISRFLRNYKTNIVQKIFPNPTNNIINISLNHKNLSSSDVFNIKIFDNLGNIVYNSSLRFDRQSDNLSFHIPSNLVTGVYKFLFNYENIFETFEVVVFK